MNHLYRKATFLKGVAELSQLPPDTGMEVAFAGRSNAGKSSALNCITDQKSLARTSKTPGRTQQINFFRLDLQRALVDLPGYGYAKVAINVKRHWQQTLEGYIRQRHALVGVVVVMDIRHPLTDFDREMVGWCQHLGRPVHILLTKADKLSRSAGMNVLQQVGRDLEREYRGGPGVTVQLFSAHDKSGVDEVRAVLDGWLDVAAG
ncbi:MAG: YihA family ribosome biogenesis GTP-binding protein [Gammaproteobacteria bacterium]|nr:YihA family ribosome biogenesis GTP-binding protein [Gammaproteobacteria bacterium]